jgi:hypothetical protein
LQRNLNKGEPVRFRTWRQDDASNEEEAAFMATGHAKFTGEVGVCLATSGPGAIHLLNGLYDAKFDHQPVVAIVGQQARAVLGGHYQQEVDLPALFKDVAGDFVQACTIVAQARHLHRSRHPKASIHQDVRSVGVGGGLDERCPGQVARQLARFRPPVSGRQVLGVTLGCERAAA